MKTINKITALIINKLSKNEKPHNPCHMTIACNINTNKNGS